MLVAAVDGLSGFPDTIAAVFPKIEVQLCIVHMVHNSLKFVSFKNWKSIIDDLKKIYSASSEESAVDELKEFSAKQDTRYLMIFRYWKSKGARPSIVYPILTTTQVSIHAPAGGATGTSVDQLTSSVGDQGK